MFHFCSAALAFTLSHSLVPVYNEPVGVCWSLQAWKAPNHSLYCFSIFWLENIKGEFVSSLGSQSAWIGDSEIESSWVEREEGWKKRRMKRPYRFYPDHWRYPLVTLITDCHIHMCLSSYLFFCIQTHTYILIYIFRFQRTNTAFECRLHSKLITITILIVVDLLVLIAISSDQVITQLLISMTLKFARRTKTTISICVI